MTNSRDKIIAAVRANQPDHRELPSLPVTSVISGTPETAPGGTSTVAIPEVPASDPGQAFIEIVEAIGGRAFLVSGYDRITTLLHEQYPDARRIVAGPGLPLRAESLPHYEDPHTLENVDLAILQAHFGVAENGACWITEDRMIERALPFIAQNLALIIDRSAIVANMHQAYERIAAIDAAADTAYGFATFIAGPSKTADIEQSLVLGAHGPRSLTVFLLDESISDEGYF